MKIDLHIHSSFSSDGSESIESIVSQVIEKHVEIISITDHANVDANPIVGKMAMNKPFTVISGVEISSFENVEQHILGYGFNAENSSLTKLLSKISDYRVSNNDMITSMLTKMGVNINWDDFVIRGRKDIAELLVRFGVVKSVSEAFDYFLDGDEYEKLLLNRVTPEETISVITNAGGKSILAHPLSISSNFNELATVIERLVGYGLSGIEAFYGPYSYEQQIELAKIADNYSLFKTAGSDFHGNGEGGRQIIGYYNQCEDAISSSLEFVNTLGSYVDKDNE